MLLSRKSAVSFQSNVRWALLALTIASVWSWAAPHTNAEDLEDIKIKEITKDEGELLVLFSYESKCSNTPKEALCRAGCNDGCGAEGAPHSLIKEASIASPDLCKKLFSQIDTDPSVGVNSKGLLHAACHGGEQPTAPGCSSCITPSASKSQLPAASNTTISQLRRGHEAVGMSGERLAGVRFPASMSLCRFTPPTTARSSTQPIPATIGPQECVTAVIGRSTVSSPTREV